MDASYFRSLYDYDSTANRRLLAALRDLPSVEPSTRDVFAHLLAAKQVWIARLRGDASPAVAIWPELSWAECESLIDENRTGFARFINECADLTEELEYENSKGTEFRTPIRDILTHVLIHSGHHRGQIAADMRRQGAEPLNTDYITHVRSG